MINTALMIRALSGVGLLGLLARCVDDPSGPQCREMGLDDYGNWQSACRDAYIEFCSSKLASLSQDPACGVGAYPDLARYDHYSNILLVTPDTHPSTTGHFYRNLYLNGACYYSCGWYGQDGSECSANLYIENTPDHYLIQASPTSGSPEVPACEIEERYLTGFREF